MRIGIKSLQDFLAFLIRRKWWVIAPFVGLSCVVAVLTKQLPRIYVSESLVLVQPRDVPENFVMDLTSTSTEQRLNSIQQMVLSRSNLISIINQYGSTVLPEIGSMNSDEAVEKLRKQIDIKFNIARDGNATAVTSFRISYQHKDQGTAQAIAGELTKLFIAEDSKTRSTHVSGTTEFLSTELEKKDTALQESEKKLRALKGEHQYELPEQLEGNQRALDRLTEQKRANTEALDRIATTRLNYEQLLSQTPEFLPQTQATRAAPAQQVEAPEEKDAVVEAYLSAKAEYDLQSAMHPATYPDVLTAKVKMDRLKAKVPPEALEAAQKPKAPKTPKTAEAAAVESKPVPNPLYMNIQAALRDLKTEFDIRQREKTTIEENMAKVTRRVENTPQVELKLTEVARENADLRKQREDLSHDLTKAQLSQSLEDKQQGAQFQVVDPANFPVAPSKPNKVVVLLVGCALSLALSIGIAFCVDLARQRVWTQSEVESFWGVPVMVDIPSIITDSDQVEIKKRRFAAAASALVGVAVYGVLLWGIYVQHELILRRLDPVLQQLVYRQ